jgi:hypothetical protein
VADSPTRDVNSYWRYVDKASNSLLAARAHARRSGQDFVDDAFIARLSRLALELNDQLTQASQKR